MADVLIVDNNEHISRMFTEVLAQDGHKVTVAANGRTALEIIESNKFEIAFIDLGLPDICGLEILKSLKIRSPLTITTVISGENDINYAIESIKSGVFRYLKKPFDLDDIKEITNLAHQERMHMVETGYCPDKRFPIKRIIQTKNTIKFLVDLPVTIIALLLGFAIQQEIYQWLEIPTVWGISEILNLTLSFVCCYCFIFLKFQPSIQLPDITKQFARDFINFTSVYVLYAAILFFMAIMIDSRLILISGYCLGLGGLWLSRFTLAPFIEGLFSGRSEGPRRIILKGFNKLADEKPVSTKPGKDPIPRTAAMEPDKDRNKTATSEAENEKSRTVADNPYEDRASRLVREFRGNRARFDRTSKRNQPKKVIH
ncbi:MAG: response regulator [candidate division Zixibacteria bacterium]|nr:response regulator [candidate division Zixibacteria bacterium]